MESIKKPILHKQLIQLITEIKTEAKIPIDKNFSPKRELDSLELVGLINDLEDLMEKNYGKTLNLLDDLIGMDCSPFETVESLTEFLENEL